ncbi:MAG: outer membrane lipoprotein-sorting protein, partial [Thermodesulfobacteriota bacterium]|nr:outer membrane lipoprotein-sorting protein [Thermodesulfobacteriota bacterium]
KMIYYRMLPCKNSYPMSGEKTRAMNRPSMKLFLAFLSACFLLAGAQSSLAMDGLTLARKVYERDDGRDSYAEIRMLLIDKRGKRRIRSMISATKDFGKLSKSLIRFTSPADIKNTVFLTWENEDRDDDQFLYLPALRRVRRIVSKQKTNRFVNTDYTYEDMQKRKVEKDNHKLLRSESFKKYDCWVLESIPKKAGASQYGKRISWVIKDIFVTVKTNFYDKKDKLIKGFVIHDLKKIDGIYTILESEMRDFKRKHRTFMKTDAIRYNRGIPDKVFTRRYLKSPK